MHEQKFLAQINTLIPTSTHKIPFLQNIIFKILIQGITLTHCYFNTFAMGTEKLYATWNCLLLPISDVKNMLFFICTCSLLMEPTII